MEVKSYSSLVNEVITNNKMTNLEVKVYKAIASACYDYSGADVTEIAEATGESKATVKGVFGSLVKKELICVSEQDVNFEKWQEANIILEEGCVSFGCDEYEE